MKRVILSLLGFALLSLLFVYQYDPVEYKYVGDPKDLFNATLK